MTPTRERFETERARIATRVAELQHEFAAIVSGSMEANLDDEHDPEGATVGFERAQVTALLEQARAHLADLDAAIARVERGTYGRCGMCGQAIAPERLDARPTAALCVSCAGSDSPRARPPRRG